MKYLPLTTYPKPMLKELMAMVRSILNSKRAPIGLTLAVIVILLKAAPVGVQAGGGKTSPAQSGPYYSQTQPPPNTDTKPAGETGPGMTNFVKPGGHFICDLPSGWGIWIDAYHEERSKVYGVFVIGPKVQKGVPVTIDVRYFAKGNTVFRNEEEYVRRNAFPDPILPPLKGEKISPIGKITVAGREARTFNRDTFEYYPPKSMDTKEIPVKERIVVVPAPEGFYVLHYEAPIVVFAQFEPVFDRVLQSFKPGH